MKLFYPLTSPLPPPQKKREKKENKASHALAIDSSMNQIQNYQMKI